MRGNAAMRIIFDRWTVIGIVLVVVVRLCQGAAGMLSLSELESASCATDYSTINNIGLALFAFLPLYLVGLQGAFAVVHKDFFLARLRSRESVVFWYGRVAFGKALCLSAAIGATAAVELVCFHGVSAFLEASCGDAITVSAILESLFFSACAFGLLAVYGLSRRIQVALASVLCYAFFDYVIDHVPGLSGAFPAIGWHLTEVAPGALPVDLAMRVTVLATIVVVGVCLSLMVFKRFDFLAGGEEDA